MRFDSILNAFINADLGKEDTSGRIIALDPVCGKEQVVERSFPLVAVMMVKTLFKFR